MMHHVLFGCSDTIRLSSIQEAATAKEGSDNEWTPNVAANRRQSRYRARDGEAFQCRWLASVHRSRQEWGQAVLGLKGGRTISIWIWKTSIAPNATFR